jgi:Carboxypeptidase regulatory-like domain
MCSHSFSAKAIVPQLIALILFCATTVAQSTGSIEGQVIDQNDAVVVAAEITASCQETQVHRVTFSDSAGRYQIYALPIGDYRLEVKARGFQRLVIDKLRVEVASRITQDGRLQVGDVAEQVTVNSVNGLIESVRNGRGPRCPLGKGERNLRRGSIPGQRDERRLYARDPG